MPGRDIPSKLLQIQPLTVQIMSVRCVGIILAGGLNTRMGGRNKAFLRLENRSYLERTIDALSDCTDKLLLVTREPDVYKKCNLEVVKDIFDVRSPLAGIHAGLVHMRAEYAFCTSCDSPLLQKEVVKILIDSIHPGVDVIVPASGTYYQPLCAVYSKRCVPFIEELLIRGEFKTDRLFEHVAVKKIPYECIQEVDPGLTSFFNVNFPEDLDTATQLLGVESGRRKASANH